MKLFALYAFALLCCTQSQSTETRIVILGDSITKGVRSGVTTEQTFGALLERSLKAQKLDVQVINQGIGGERTDQAYQRLNRDVIALKPQIVTIMYGTNDSYVDQGKHNSRLTEDEYAKNLKLIIQELQRSGIQPILMTSPRWGDQATTNGAGEHPNVRLEPYVKRARQVAEETKVPLVDHYALWTQSRDKGIDLGKWTTDQCHPNPTGHQELAKAIEKVVASLIQPVTPRD